MRSSLASRRSPARKETIHPGPVLMEQTPAEKAEILMGEHRCESDGFLAVQAAFRNGAPGLRGGRQGTEPVDQVPALAERGRSRVAGVSQHLERRPPAMPWLVRCEREGYVDRPVRRRAPRATKWTTLTIIRNCWA